MNEDKRIDCWLLAKEIIIYQIFTSNESEDNIRKAIDLELELFPDYYPEILVNRGITIVEWEEFSKEIKTMPMEDLNNLITRVIDTNTLGLPSNHSMN